MDGEAEVLDLAGESAADESAIESTEEIGEVAEETAPETIEEIQPGTEGKPQVSPFTKYKADLAELKATKPELVKDIQRAFGKVASIDKLGTTEQITQQLEAIGLHGGVEGLQTLADTATRAAELDKGFEAGDPALIEGWSKDFPEGFSKLVFPSVAKLEQLNPAAYESGMTREAGRFLEKYGTFGSLQELGKLIDPANKAAVDAYNAIVKNVFAPLQSAASKVNQPDPLASERQKLADREKELTANDQKVFRESVIKDVNANVRTELKKQVASILKGKNVSDRVFVNIETEISRLVNADPNYSKQIGSIFASKDKERTTQFIMSRAIAKAPAAIRTVLKELGVSGTAPKVAAKPAGQSASATIPGVPNTSDVDFTRTDMATFVATKRSHGEAWLKNGKKAKW